MRHHPQQPLVFDRVEEVAYVDIEPQLRRWLMIGVCKGVKRHMRIPPRPEALGEPEEVDLVDGAQHLGYCVLDNRVELSPNLGNARGRSGGGCWPSPVFKSACLSRKSATDR